MAWCAAVYTVAATGTTWLPLEGVVNALGLDQSEQAQELAEAYALTVGSDPKTGVMSVLIPSKVSSPHRSVTASVSALH